MSTKFASWVSKRIFEEGAFGNWEYQIPTDKKQQMYDFYMLENLLPPGRKDHLLNNKVKDEPNPPEERSHAEEFHNALEDTANRLLPTLKSELEEVLMFSLAAELRHLYDRSDNKTGTPGSKPYQTLFEAVKKGVGPEEADLLKKYTINLLNMKNPDTKDLFDRQKISHNLANSNSGYKTSYRAMKAAGGTDDQWARICQWLFTNAKWNGSYGGKPWAGIAAGFRHLHHSKKAEDIINYIDHVYDLQHNTDTVFNKVASYMKEGGYSWVKEALDHKRYLASPHEMIEHVSPGMRQLALAGIKVIEGKTWEDFEREWPEVLKKKTAVYNQTKEIEYEKKKAKGELYYGEKPPKPITPEQFAAQKIKHSDSPWSIYKVHEKHKAKMANAPSPYAGGPTAPHPYISAAPSTPAVTVFKDADGKDIQVGDTVKKKITSLNNIGKVKTLNHDGTVTVQWKPAAFSSSLPYEKTYQAAQLVVTPTVAPAPAAVTPTAAPKPEPVLGGLLDPLNFFNVGDKVSDSSGEWYTITDKNNGKLIVTSPLSGYKVMLPTDVKDHKKTPKPAPANPPVTAAPKAPANPPVSSFTAAPKTPPKTKHEENTERVKQIWTSLPKSGQNLKIARLIMGAKLGLTFSDALSFVEKAIGVNLDENKKNTIKDVYQGEQDRNDYYKTKNHNNFPIGLGKDEAWKMIKLKFPHPPHVYLNNEIEDQISALLKQDAGSGDVQAVNLIKKATQYDIAAAKALAVLKKLEMYAGDDTN